LSSYEVVPVVTEESAGKVVSETGWVSKYRIVSSVYRKWITALTVRLLAPDGSTLVSQYVLPTRFVETEYSLPQVTVFLGVVKVGGAAPVSTTTATATTTSATSPTGTPTAQPSPIAVPE
jgi:hypothetical protein